MSGSERAAGGQIGLEQMGIAQILRNYWLQVPLNQREYRWTEAHVTSLFHDISKAIDVDPEYFLGSIVTIPRADNVLEVVDGQQRLTTTAILLAAIRDYLSDRESDKLIVDDIQNNLLTSIDRAKRERPSRLRLNVTDAVYFERRIIGADRSTSKTSPSHELIDQAANLAADHVRRIVASHDPKNHGDVLDRWMTYLEQYAVVVLLRVPTTQGAYKMFETLNDRGLKITQADLVKSYLFGQARNRQNEAQEKWAGMRAILESFEDDDTTVLFLRQILISMKGYLKESEVYEVVQKTATGATRALSFLDDLERGATDFVAIQTSEHEKWNGYPVGIRRAIATLRSLRMNPLRPLLLSIAREFSPKEAALAMQLMISVAVRFLVVGGARSGGVEQAIAAVAKKVSNREIQTAAELMKNLEAVVPADGEFEEAFAIATVSNASLARYYLRSLHGTVSGDPNPWFLPNDDERIINLEHVLPRSPEGNWPQFNDDEAKAYYRRIGNLALLQAVSNSNLRSADFATKRPVLAQSPYPLTSQIATLEEWGPQEISDRQKVLARMAPKTWPLSVRG